MHSRHTSVHHPRTRATTGCQLTSTRATGGDHACSQGLLLCCSFGCKEKGSPLGVQKMHWGSANLKSTCSYNQGASHAATRLQPVGALTCCVPVPTSPCLNTPRRASGQWHLGRCLTLAVHTHEVADYVTAPTAQGHLGHPL